MPLMNAIGSSFPRSIAKCANLCPVEYHCRRQLERIAKAKAASVYKGRPASIDAEQVRKMKTDGMVLTEIAKALNIGRASVYCVLS